MSIWSARLLPRLTSIFHIFAALLFNVRTYNFLLLKVFRLLALLFFLPLSNTGHANDIGDLLKRERELKSVTNPGDRIVYLYGLSEAFFEVDSVKYAKYLHEAFNLAIAGNDSVMIAYYHGLMSLRAFNRNDYDKAVSFAKMSSSILWERHDTLSYLRSEYVHAVSYYNLKQPDKAEPILLKALNIALAGGVDVETGKLYTYLAHIYRDQRKHETVWAYQQAIRHIVASGDLKWIFSLYRSLAYYYAGTNQPDSALYYGRKTMEAVRGIEPFSKVSFLSTAPLLSSLLLIQEHYDEATDLIRETGLRSIDVSNEGTRLANRERQVNYLYILRQKTRFHNLLAMIGFFVTLLFGTISFTFYHKIKNRRAELAKLNEKLSGSLEQNQILLRETQHRVKNNFQMVISMLNIHELAPGQTHEEFMRQSTSRIAAMAKVNELLYQQPELTKLSLHHYLSDVVNSTIFSLVTDYEQFGIHLKTRGLTFDIQTTLLLGLIVNELLINTIKHACKKQGHGSVYIDFNVKENGYELLYRDNGPGITADAYNSNSSGLDLIRSLARQLNGSASFSNNVKAHCHVSFQPNMTKE
jgi:two-component sensor histidine kinase